MSTIFDCRCSETIGGLFPELDVPAQGVDRLIDPQHVRKLPLRLPDLAEPQVARHYTKLSKLNFGVDDGFYPLGSCTMKYNPKLNEAMSNLLGFADLHPRSDVSQSPVV